MRMTRGRAWTLAVVVTLASAIFQRITGPSYPSRGKAALSGTDIRYRLPRSADNSRDCEISVRVPDVGLMGRVSYRRYRTEGDWTDVPLERRGDHLAASLPRQPAAGKLAYRVFIGAPGNEVSLTGDVPVVIRFKRSVPAAIIIFHVLVMFSALLFSAMAGISSLGRTGSPRKYAARAAAFLFIGGFILGPIVQKIAFGVYWAGFPFGTDLTDNKTLISMIVWIAALVAGRKGKEARGWVFAASLITLFINLIPHSLMGSEHKYL
jgi:hypothetical protein